MARGLKHINKNISLMPEYLDRTELKLRSIIMKQKAIIDNQKNQINNLKQRIFKLLENEKPQNTKYQGRFYGR